MRLYLNYIIYLLANFYSALTEKFLKSHFPFIPTQEYAPMIVVLIAQPFLYAYIYNMLNDIFVALFTACLKNSMHDATLLHHKL